MNGLVPQSLAVSRAVGQRLHVHCAGCTGLPHLFLTATDCRSSLLNISVSGAAPELTLTLNAQALEMGNSCSPVLKGC